MKAWITLLLLSTASAPAWTGETTFAKIYEGKATQAAAVIGLGCQLRIYLTNNKITGFSISDTGYQFPLKQPPAPIPPLNTFFQTEMASADGNESLVVRFYHDEESAGPGLPSEYEYRRRKDPPRAVFCKELRD